MFVHAHVYLYRVIINECPIAVGVENPHKFWMCRQPRNVKVRTDMQQNIVTQDRRVSSLDGTL
jgi:hypothetical protein